jgi:deoxyadenosine/deoxycytidine kinase
MSTLDFQNYMKMRNVMLGDDRMSLNRLMVPHLVIYLKCDPEVCQKRISSRGRDCEQTIPLDYLKGLDDLYKEMIHEMEARGSRILELGWNEFKPMSDVMPEIDKFLVRTSA